MCGDASLKVTFYSLEVQFVKHLEQINVCVAIIIIHFLKVKLLCNCTFATSYVPFSTNRTFLIE